MIDALLHRKLNKKEVDPDTKLQYGCGCFNKQNLKNKKNNSLRIYLKMKAVSVARGSTNRYKQYLNPFETEKKQPKNTRKETRNLKWGGVAAWDCSLPEA